VLWFSACLSGHSSVPAPPASFTVTAGDTTMASGGGLISYTLTSVNGFTGSVSVSCLPPLPAPGVLEPVCGGGPVSPPVMLAANATATGSVNLETYVYFPPKSAALQKNPGAARGVSLALAGCLMLGLSLRRRNKLKCSYPAIAVATLVALGGITACSSGPETLTPGVYSYTLSASEVGNSAAPVTTTLKVTVPPGIDVQGAPPPI
jgi:hypothetical protein